MYKTNEGKVLKVYAISSERFSEMEVNGYNYLLVYAGETAQMAYNRLIDRGYTKVRIYEESTRVRGYHSLYAMAKW